jgi:hypothetical protein
MIPLTSTAPFSVESRDRKRYFIATASLQKSAMQKVGPLSADALIEEQQNANE